MKTFSQAPTETNQLGDIINVLNILPDNTTKLISPKDVRDAVYTLWENTMFKPTSFSGSSVDYIGIDQYQLEDDNEVDWYPKVYFGKKQTGGQFIMNDDLLSQTDADFFFYNTKNNGVLSDYTTSIAILSGTGSYYSNGTLKAPQIKSTPFSDENGFYMDLNIRNTSYNMVGLSGYGGNINIRSEKGYVSINDFFFPESKTITDNIDAYDGHVLTLVKGGDNRAYGVWRSPFSQSITSIITGDDFTIQSPSITLDGYNFIDSTIVATGIGGIRAGESFSNGVDVLDMLRRIVYTYVSPQISSLLTLSNNTTQVKLIEKGDSVTYMSLVLRASVTKNATQSLTSIEYLPSPSVKENEPTPQNFPSPGSIGNGDTNAIYKPNQPFDISGDDNYKILTFTLSVTDQYPTTKTVGSTLKTVYPYFYGTATTSATQSIDMNKILGTNSSAPLGKLKSYLAEPIISSATYSDNQYLKITTRGLGIGEGKGYVYFGYPSGYPLLQKIFDDNSLNITSDFKTYSIAIKHAGAPALWGSGALGKDYIFYILGETQVPLSSSTFSFIFAE
jgi:hypothetical protein